MATNIFDPKWDAERDDGAYRWRRARVGRQAGCERLGASLFEVPPAASSFPLHAHYANEELVLVLTGSPTLETLDAERQLHAGEIVTCPAGPQGTHRLRNDTDEAARALILSTMRAPEVNAFPESGELWVRDYPPGAEPPGGALDLRVAADVGNDSETPASPRPAETELPNFLHPSFDAGEPGKGGRAKLGRQAGAKLLGLSLYELPPRFERTAYHFHFGNEELLIALAGTLTLRTPDGWKDLEPGDLVALPRGERGAHRPINKTDDPIRYLVASEMNAPDVVIYPDSQKVLAISRAPGSTQDEDEFAHWFRIEDAVGYWEGEPGPIDPD